jgi:hypothetical protein
MRIIGLLELLGYALAVTTVYMLFNGLIGVNNSKATGISVLRAQGYPIMLIGAFTVVLGFVITRVDMVVGPGGRPHFFLK